jgi:tetratricopeptide (TPR) repeat protein
MAEPDEGSKAPAAETTSAARQAIYHLEKAHRSDGTDRDVGLDLALARLYLQVGDNEKGAALLRRVVEYEPDAGEAYVLLAHAERMRYRIAVIDSAQHQTISDVLRLQGTGQFKETVPVLDDQGHMLPTEVERLGRWRHRS